jgi:hypothetical protein
VIPGQPSSFRQYCVDISPQFECSIARTVYYVASASGTHTVSFNVLGARPVQVNVESLWADHYPVDSLSYNPEASNSTTLHVVEFVTENVFFVASESVDVYLVVTASNSYGSSTLCLPLTLIGGILNVSNLPKNDQYAQRHSTCCTERPDRHWPAMTF